VTGRRGDKETLMKLVDREKGDWETRRQGDKETLMKLEDREN